MEIEVRFVRGKGFRQDLAFFGIEEDSIELLKRNLASNPVLGKPDAVDPLLRCYRFLGHNVTYRIIENEIGKGIVTIWLITCRPVDRPKADLTGRAMRLLEVYGKIRGVLGDVLKDDD
ncbi:MAG: hypothetical protein VYD64_00495 [Pseudomonadota bacterium]|nr:hypothetical protein [Pseudomonadota bacterium]